jgi:hypothetical protein
LKRFKVFDPFSSKRMMNNIVLQGKITVNQVQAHLDWLTHLIHDYYKRQLGLVENAASVQHI